MSHLQEDSRFPIKRLNLARAHHTPLFQVSLLFCEIRLFFLHIFFLQNDHDTLIQRKLKLELDFQGVPDCSGASISIGTPSCVAWRILDFVPFYFVAFMLLGSFFIFIFEFVFSYKNI